jgi:hypothetical protein
MTTSAAMLAFIVYLAANADDEDYQGGNPEECGYGSSKHVTSRPVALGR